MGGPILKDKAWLWGSYGVQDIFEYAVTGTVQSRSSRTTTSS